MAIEQEGIYVHGRKATFEERIWKNGETYQGTRINTRLAAWGIFAALNTAEDTIRPLK